MAQVKVDEGNRILMTGEYIYFIYSEKCIQCIHLQVWDLNCNGKVLSLKVSFFTKRKAHSFVVNCSTKIVTYN